MLLKNGAELIELYLGAAFTADDLFGNLSVETLHSLADIKHTIYFNKGVAICAAGQSPSGIYIFCQGRAQLIATKHNGRPHIIGSIRALEVLGLSETIANQPFETTVKTLTQCRADFIRRNDLLRFLLDEPQVCFQLVRLLSSSLQDVCKSLRCIAF